MKSEPSLALVTVTLASEWVSTKRKRNIHQRQLHSNIDILNTWNAGGNTDLPPIAQASRSRDCSYKAGGESVSIELELAEGYNQWRQMQRNQKNYSHHDKLQRTEMNGRTFIILFPNPLLNFDSCKLDGTADEGLRDEGVDDKFCHQTSRAFKVRCPHASH